MTAETSKPDALVEAVARAICGRQVADVDCERACLSAGKCVGRVAECIYEDARAALAIARPIIEAEAEFHSFELEQEEMVVASASAHTTDEAKALAEIQHYAAMYGQDGPVQIYRVTRRAMKGPAK